MCWWRAASASAWGTPGIKLGLPTDLAQEACFLQVLAPTLTNLLSIYRSGTRLGLVPTIPCCEVLYYAFIAQPWIYVLSLLRTLGA